MKDTIQVHHFNTDPFNWYVVEEQSRLTVVDAGFPGHYKTFLKGLSSIGRELKDVEAIIVTHAHADHTGFAERLRQTSGAPLFIHELDQAAAQRVLQLPWLGLLGNIWRPFGRSILARATVEGIFRMTSLPKAYPLSDRQVLDVPGRPQVIHMPGHTAGEIALHLPENSCLFSGDTLVTQNLLTGELGLPQLPARPLSSDYAQSQRSLARLKELGQVTMYPGHGRAWKGDMAEAVEVALELSPRLRRAHT